MQVKIECPCTCVLNIRQVFTLGVFTFPHECIYTDIFCDNVRCEISKQIHVCDLAAEPFEIQSIDSY